MSSDHRVKAQAEVERLLGLFRADANVAQMTALIAETEALSRAVAAFHIEGIRFRMFNVDRLLTRGAIPVPAGSTEVFVNLRRELEAAGFHTRSHSAPPSGQSS
jgi:hypothetical protein